jgi:hypothetical protein
LDPGIAGSVGAALWCLYRFEALGRELPPGQSHPSRGTHRGRATAWHGLVRAWHAAAVVLSGASACLLAGLALAALARPHPLAAALYCAVCAAVLALLLAVETLDAAYRSRLQREAANRRRRRSVRTLMRAGPPSVLPF